MFILILETTKLNTDTKNPNMKWSLIRNNHQAGDKLLLRGSGWTLVEDLKAGCSVFSFKRGRFEKLVSLVETQPDGLNSKHCPVSPPHCVEIKKPYISSNNPTPVKMPPGVQATTWFQL